MILLLKNSEKVIDFLVENSGKWEIKGNSIIFSTTTLSNEYNKLLDSLIEETTSEETDPVAKNMVNSFEWKEN